MLRNRWFRWTAALALLLAAGFIHFTIWAARPGITLSNFNRLEVGMTQADAEELLDGPPGIKGDNDPIINNPWFGLMLLCTPGGGRSRLIWTNDDAAVILIFDANHRL